MGRRSSGTVVGLRVRVQANRLALGQAIAAAIEGVVRVPVIADRTDPTQTHRTSHRPDVVVVAGSTIHGSTTAGVRTARRRWPQARVIAIADTDLVSEGVALVGQGADAWLSAIDGLDVLYDLLTRIAAGDKVLLPPAALSEIAAALNRPNVGRVAAAKDLTSRESQVLACFANGLPPAQIAELLLISRATLRTHVQNILRKLDLHSIHQAALLTLREDPNAVTGLGLDGSSEPPRPPGALTAHT